jgi:alpha-L-fucosidase 2
VRGLRARGACTVDIEWRNGQLVEANLRSDRGGRYRLCYGAGSLEMEMPAAARVTVVFRDGALQRR